MPRPIHDPAVRAGMERRKRLSRSARRVGVVTYIAVSYIPVNSRGLLTLGLALSVLRLAVLQLPSCSNSIEGVVAVEAILRLEDVEHAAQCRVLLAHLVVVTHKSGVSLVLLPLVGAQ